MASFQKTPPKKIPFFCNECSICFSDEIKYKEHFNTESHKSNMMKEEEYDSYDSEKHGPREMNLYKCRQGEEKVGISEKAEPKKEDKSDEKRLMESTCKLQNLSLLNAAPPRNPAVKAKVLNSKGAANEASGRMKGITIVKPVVYGNVAWYLGEKKDEDGHTHKWTVYLRSYDNEDMSVYVKRVEFKLHETYAEPNRIVQAPPYTITETGWGEFEIAIKIFFRDSNERPVTISHFLKLSEREEDGNVKVVPGPVNSELYDNLVFVDPTVKMHKLLTQPKLSTSVTSHNTNYEVKKVQDLKKILEAKQKGNMMKEEEYDSYDSEKYGPREMNLYKRRQGEEKVGISEKAEPKKEDKSDEKRLMESTCKLQNLSLPNAAPPRNPAVKAKVLNSKGAANEASGRMNGITIVKPVVYGNVAWYLGEKKDEDGHTHQWTVYLRSYDNEDMSVYVKRVEFKLHETYAEPNRIVQAPPYTITETGWGEFEIAIKIFFRDSNERPVTISHFLKLSEREEDGNVKVVPGPVNSELYDNLVFVDPTVKMHKLLTQPKLSTSVTSHNTNYEVKKVQDLKKILEAKQKGNMMKEEEYDSYDSEKYGPREMNLYKRRQGEEKVGISEKAEPKKEDKSDEKRLMESTCKLQNLSLPNAAPPRNPAVKAKVLNSKGAANEGSGRMKGITIVKPVVYGNVAWYLGEKKDEDGHTHKWTVYLRSYDNEDMSVYVKQVEFKLHETYAEPNRIVQAPPYTITETGWGEFEIAIKIFFRDSNERPVTISHFLKLSEREEDGNVKVVPGPVNSELYDNLVFVDPTVKMHKLLTQPKLSTSVTSHNTNYEVKKVQDLKKILEAKQKGNMMKEEEYDSYDSEKYGPREMNLYKRRQGEEKVGISEKAEPKKEDKSDEKRLMESTCKLQNLSLPNAASPRNPAVKAKVLNSKGAANEASGRMNGITIVKPVVYGNVAWYLGEKKDEDGHTHQWTVYLRSYDNEDMSVYVKRVQFKLHETYAEPNRIVQAPPYTITETGWGEFEIAIKIFFRDSNERPVTISHFLKLSEREEDGNVKVVPGPVNSEFYDELVFVDPTVKMHKLLTQPKLSTSVTSHNTNYEVKKVQDLKKILEAKEKVKQDIEDLKQKLANTKDEIQKMRKKVGQ